MRYLYAGFSLLITITFIWLLDHPVAGQPPLGRILDPVNGCWANAEPVHKNYDQQWHIKGCKEPVTIWLEERMVPHIRAANDHDLYMAEGYIHAYFRLWQMDMQTRAAGGRVSEVAGERALQFDRTQRRKGMVYGAKHSLRAMEADPHTKEMLDAYTAGINSYIHSLSYRSMPLEYKLMDFVPEDWTNLKSALLLKYMADDLTGYTEDFPLTYLRDRLPEGEIDALFPAKIPGYDPVIPKGTTFEQASMKVPAVPGNADSLFAHLPDVPDSVKIAAADKPPADGIGSNNWAVSGKYTAGGAPVLCNDPHLGLNLPSLWFEVQLQVPGMNCYGASLPGAPGVVIGFTGNISWGFTNNYRDVKDFYEIASVNDGDDAYWFNGKQQPFTKEYEVIKIKGKPTYIDKVLYTVHGPVMYDEHFEDPAHTHRKYALTWMAHRATNELLAIYKLNRAQNYVDYVTAIMHFQCPAQNMLYADREGNIALWGQGQFINKWQGQGKYVMEGKDSLTLWGRDIPMNENPHVINPPQGYIASANQAVTDETYPYWYNGHFLEFRAWEINDILRQLAARNAVAQPFLSRSRIAGDQSGNVMDCKGGCIGMAEMQNNTASLLAAKMIPVLERFVPGVFNDPSDRVNHHWAGVLTDTSQLASLFQLWWASLYDNIWTDDFASLPEGLRPAPEVTMQLLLTDTASAYYDDRRTAQKETMRDMILRSFKAASDSLAKLKATGGQQWYIVKNTTVRHLAKLPAFSYDHLKIGGWGNTINAVKDNHGPSWRMIVQMKKNGVEGYGIYPGGQSGNPGSKHYADFLDQWVNGQYNSLVFLPDSQQQTNKAIRYTCRIIP